MITNKYDEWEISMLYLFMKNNNHAFITIKVIDDFEQYMKELGYSEKLLDPNGDIIMD